jgi:hypothetical protein
MKKRPYSKFHNLKVSAYTAQTFTAGSRLGKAHLRKVVTISTAIAIIISRVLLRLGKGRKIALPCLFHCRLRL